jgi:hypothetical protein
MPLLDRQGNRRFHGFRACPKGHPGKTISGIRFLHKLESRATIGLTPSFGGRGSDPLTWPSCPEGPTSRQVLLSEGLVEFSDDHAEG